MLSKSIGNTLCQLRKKRAWSQEQVADILHISRSSYQRIEAGEGFSWASHLEKICEVFEISPEQLLQQSTVIFNSQQQGGTSNNAYIFHQISDKLIEQYELRIKEKDALIEELKLKINPH